MRCTGWTLWFQKHTFSEATAITRNVMNHGGLSHDDFLTHQEPEPDLLQPETGDNLWHCEQCHYLTQPNSLLKEVILSVCLICCNSNSLHSIDMTMPSMDCGPYSQKYTVFLSCICTSSCTTFKPTTCLSVLLECAPHELLCCHCWSLLFGV